MKNRVYARKSDGDGGAGEKERKTEADVVG